MDSATFTTEVRSQTGEDREATDAIKTYHLLEIALKAGATVIFRPSRSDRVQCDLPEFHVLCNDDNHCDALTRAVEGALRCKEARV